jgi:hypothetical protein
MTETLTAKEIIDVIEKTLVELRKIPPDQAMPVTAPMFKMGMDLGYAMQCKMEKEKKEAEEKKTPPPTPTEPPGYS